MNNPVQAPAASPSYNNLKITICDIDFLSQEGFSKISALATITTSYLENTPPGVLNMESIVYILRTIKSVAVEYEGSINSQAEEVGCNYIEDKQAQEKVSPKVSPIA